MNREVNKGVELNRQTDMLPVFALLPEEEKKADYFLTFLADELSVEKTDILDFELTVYCKEIRNSSVSTMILSQVRAWIT